MISLRFRRLYCLVALLALHYAQAQDASSLDLSASTIEATHSLDDSTPISVHVQPTQRTVPLDEGTLVLESLQSIVERAMESVSASASLAEAPSPSAAKEQTTESVLETPTSEVESATFVAEERPTATPKAVEVTPEEALPSESAVLDTPTSSEVETAGTQPTATPQEALETTATFEPVPSSSQVEESTVATPEASPVVPEETAHEPETTAAPSQDAPVAVDDTAGQVPLQENLPDLLNDLGIETLDITDLDDLDSFLGGLGLDLEAEDVYNPDFVVEEEDVELSAAELEELKRLQEEEQKEIKARKTKDERARIEGVMAASYTRLSALAVQRNKDLRKMLVRQRKAAAAKLQDPNTPIGAALPGLKTEAHKLVKGLEAYYKKETSKGRPTTKQALTKWYGVVQKVEEKIAEKVQATQADLHEFHAATKNQEIEDGMEMIAEVKAQCGAAQAEVGMDLSWLDDVTYMDWQVYHDLARIGEQFQKEASEIQGGTTDHPPKDAFIDQLGLVEADLQTYVNGIVGRLEALKSWAEDALSPEEGHDEL